MRRNDWGKNPASPSGRLSAAIFVLLIGNLLALATIDGQSRSAASSDVASAPTETTVAAVTTSLPPTTVITAAPRPVQKRASSATSTVPTTTTAPTDVPSANLPYKYQVDITPRCARVGEEFTATVRVHPRVSVIMLATYSDGENYETWHVNIAGDDGVIVYKWKAPPIPGEAMMWTRAHNPETKQDGATDVLFNVVDLTGSC